MQTKRGHFHITSNSFLPSLPPSLPLSPSDINNQVAEAHELAKLQVKRHHLEKWITEPWFAVRLLPPSFPPSLPSSLPPSLHLGQILTPPFSYSQSRPSSKVPLSGPTSTPSKAGPSKATSFWK